MGWQNIVVGAQKHDPVYTSTQGTRENNHANTSELAAAASLVGVCEADSVFAGTALMAVRALPRWIPKHSLRLRSQGSCSCAHGPLQWLATLWTCVAASTGLSLAPRPMTWISPSSRVPVSTASICEANEMTGTGAFPELGGPGLKASLQLRQLVKTCTNA